MSYPPTDHPDADQLLAFAEHRLIDHEIEQHLESCEICAEAVLIAREIMVIAEEKLVPPLSSTDAQVEKDRLRGFLKRGQLSNPDRQNTEVVSISIDSNVSTHRSTSLDNITKRKIHENMDVQGRITEDFVKPATASNVANATRRTRTTRFQQILLWTIPINICVLIGLVANRFSFSQPERKFEILLANAEMQSLAGRGKETEARIIVISSDRKGFATVIGLFNTDPPLVFPGLDVGAINVRPGTVEAPPLSPGMDEAILLLVVMTEQPAADLIRKTVYDGEFKARQIAELQQALANSLQENNYHWVAFSRIEAK